MGCNPAVACRAALAEATRRWPNRRRTSDGICGDPRHQARVSDHNSGNAWDLSHDPANGCNAHDLVEQIRLRRDPRVKYIISNRRIAGPGTRQGGWEWQPYSGSNPHTSHAHVSIWGSGRDNTASWFGVQMPPSAPPSPPPASPWGPRPYPGYRGKYGGYNREEFEGRKDGNVEWIQRSLNNTNLEPKLVADGRFGAATDRAVRGFQAALKLAADGVVGPVTWGRLNQWAR